MAEPVEQPGDDVVGDPVESLVAGEVGFVDQSAQRVGDVFGSHSTSCAVECAHPVRSNASRISMISLSSFLTGPHGPRVHDNTERTAGGTTLNGPTRRQSRQPPREISCPHDGRCGVCLQGDWPARCQSWAPTWHWLPSTGWSRRELEGERGLGHALFIHAEAELFHVAGPDFDLGEYVEGER